MTVAASLSTTRRETNGQGPTVLGLLEHSGTSQQMVASKAEDKSHGHNLEYQMRNFSQKSLQLYKSHQHSYIRWVAAVKFWKSYGSKIL
jgi:hypothetical protein